MTTLIRESFANREELADWEGWGIYALNVPTMKEYRKRGSGSGRAVYDDPRVAVEPLVLSESAAVAQAETK